MKIGDMELYDYQETAVQSLKSGNLLLAGVGSGKTFMAIAWASQYLPDREFIVITTAMNRDKRDWHDSVELCGIKDYTIDSWNNITNYVHKENCVFVFDEQRAVGSGKWAMSFIKIARADNKWILTSATPGDTWMDWCSLFVANGFYRNKTEFTRNHVEYNPHVKWPQIKAYHKEYILEELRHSITVKSHKERHTTRHRSYLSCSYDTGMYSEVAKTYMNPFTEEPITSPSTYTQVLRRITAMSEDRQSKLSELLKRHPRVIIFYNFTYELEILKSVCEDMELEYYEYNGKKHEFIPDEDQWVYLVQYNAGAEGWNCITTDTIIFYSANHSYKKMEQAEGRIDRVNTPYKHLRYYYLTSSAKVDKDILEAIGRKKRFNEKLWAKRIAKLAPWDK